MVLPLGVEPHVVLVRRVGLWIEVVVAPPVVVVDQMVGVEFLGEWRVTASLSHPVLDRAALTMRMMAVLLGRIALSMRTIRMDLPFATIFGPVATLLKIMVPRPIAAMTRRVLMLVDFTAVPRCVRVKMMLGGMLLLLLLLIHVLPVVIARVEMMIGRVGGANRTHFQRRNRSIETAARRGRERRRSAHK